MPCSPLVAHALAAAPARLLLGGLMCALAATPAQGNPVLGEQQGMVVLDYQVVPVPGLKSLDLAGLHFFGRINDWLHLGVGAYAPLVRGEYGGFMAVDATAHVQRRLHGRFFGAAGLALGGGGGGKSAEQSKVLSGTGGYTKVYAGLGYEFNGFSAGLNVSRMRFAGSLIDHTQPNLFVQVPFGYRAAAYADAGRQVQAGADDSGQTMLTLGLDNLRQIDPQGSNTGTIHTVNLQFARFFSGQTYWFVDAGLGWRGLPLYNHLIGGIGQRWRLGPGLNLYGQLGVGSGGYAPDTIDTGPGLLVYPKLSAEWMLNRHLGLAVSAGYLAAPRGSSKNATLGAALNYHFSPAGGGEGPSLLRGMRVHLMHQTEFDVSVASSVQSNLKLLTVQVDLLAGERLYLPVQLGVATNAYADYPGYGEVLFGAGLQSRYSRGERWQWFGQMLVGPNVHGLVLKPQVGLNFGLSDRLALAAQVGKTIGVGNYGQNTNKQKLRANAVSLGLTYRFSVPGS